MTTNNIAFLFCAHYASEGKMALDSLSLEGSCMAVFEPRCGRPPVDEAELTKVIEKLDGVRHMELFGGCCLSKLSDGDLKGCRLHIHRFANCFAMLLDQRIIDECLAKRAYLTTPGWLANWPANMKRLGLDQDTARAIFAEAIDRIVLLDTGYDNHCVKRLGQFSDFVGRPHETIHIGLDIFKLMISHAYQLRQYESRLEKLSADYRTLQKQATTNAMAIDLLTSLARVVDEEQAVEGMMNVYAMLFAPKTINYLEFERGLPDRLWTRPHCSDDIELAAIKKRLAAVEAESGYTRSGHGFVLRITKRGVATGVIELDEVAFPENLDQYLNQALGIVNISVLPIENARKYQKLAAIEDKLRKANQQLVQLATTDALTGIANRRTYDECIEREWRRMLREQLPLSLVICDIDFFKRFNDHYGHDEGDDCLRKVARAIDSQAMRPGDVAARYGGEEFVMIMPATPAEGALHIAERIRQSVAELNIPHACSDAAPYVTVSIGVSQVAPQDAQDMSISALFHAADVALYQAKRQGRNRSVLNMVSGE